MSEPAHSQGAPGAGRASRVTAALRALRGGPGTLLGLLILIWAVLPLIPDDTGIRFGLGYRAFFTAMLLLGTLFFWFLGKQRIAPPRGSGGVLASLAAVYLVTTGVLVAAGSVYPQFPRPQPPGAAAQEAAGRGKELFWGASVGCFRCHSIGGKGGTRAPDLTHVASRAGQRVPGLTAERYLSEKVKAGATYEYKVPEYAPIMPPFGQVLSQEQLENLVAYLLTLK
ncbi:MAG: cytochrome c [Chloroflexi bacterium]|nr:cytochrome c [Chloroflexota bacterium]